MRLKNKIAIITGANGGMGLEIVEKFLGEGAKVVAVDLNLSKVSKAFTYESENLLEVKTDITDSDEVNEMVDKALKHFGRIDILVNTAGIAQSATPIEDVTNEHWDKIMSINAKSLFLTNRAVVPIMKKQQSGSIINIGSISAVRPRPGLNVYIASKGAALAFTQALAIEVADSKVRVNAINPGPSDTSMLGKFSAKGIDIEETKENVYKKSVPLGELIQPEDIAYAAVYLSSDEAIRVTGSIFNIDGGRGL